MNPPQGWYRASDGNWYYGQHPQPYAAPPQPDGHGGWTEPVAMAAVPPPPPAPAGPPLDGWVRRHKKLSAAGAAFAAFVVVGALADPGTDDARGVRTLTDSAPNEVVTTTPATVPTTAAPVPPPTTAPATTRPPRTTAPSPVAVRTTAPAPTRSAAPTKAAARTCGAPANPWGYHFCGSGSVITSPPASFCDYFDCIDSFWENTKGYVMQCEDGMFSHSGGRSGSCSHHGGNDRPLYR